MNLPRRTFDIMNSFKMAAFITFEAVDGIKFVNPKPEEELQISACHHTVDLHKHRFSSRFYLFPSRNLRFMII